MFTNCTLPFSLTHTHTVTNLRAVNTTTNSTTITWDQPPHNYRVFLHGEATDNIPQSRVIHLVNVTGQTTHNIGGLNSFRNYSIGVYLESDLGQGSNATVTFQTQGRCECADDTMHITIHMSFMYLLYVRECNIGNAQWSTTIHMPLVYLRVKDRVHV